MEIPYILIQLQWKMRHGATFEEVLFGDDFPSLLLMFLKAGEETL